MRWDRASRGRYEVWHLTVNHRGSGLGAWIRYTLEAPDQGHAARVGGEHFREVWTNAKGWVNKGEWLRAWHGDVLEKDPGETVPAAIRCAPGTGARTNLSRTGSRSPGGLVEVRSKGVNVAILRPWPAFRLSER